MHFVHNKKPFVDPEMEFLKISREDIILASCPDDETDIGNFDFEQMMHAEGC